MVSILGVKKSLVAADIYLTWEHWLKVDIVSRDMSADQSMRDATNRLESKL